MAVIANRQMRERAKALGIEGATTLHTDEVLLALRNHSPEGNEIRQRYLDAVEIERQADEDEHRASARHCF